MKERWQDKRKPVTNWAVLRISLALCGIKARFALAGVHQGEQCTAEMRIVEIVFLSCTLL